MEEKEKKPKIRFKGFTEAWEQRKVNEIFSKITRGYVLAVNQTKSNKDDKYKYPVYSSQTQNNGLMGYYKEYLFDTAITWTTDGANAGTVKYRDGKFYCTNVCGVLLSQEGYANKMISEALNNIAWKHVSKVGNPKLMNNVMGDIQITIPKDLKEQKQMSDLFKNIDNLITLHQHKYDKLVNVKKSLLEKMFPKNGNNVPEIRFRSFTEVWEQSKLCKIAKYRNGKAHENDIDDNGKYVVINSKFVSSNGKIRKNSDKQNEPLFKNEIAFVLSDVPNGKALAKTYIVEESGKYTLNQRIAGITPNKDINPYYLYILMNRNKYFLKLDDGAKQTNICKDDMEKFEEFYPSKKEQDTIGTLFDRLDNLITLHQLNIDKLKNVKKSLLEKMFI